MAWFVVCVAGLLEVAWALGLKRTEGFTKVGPSLAVLAALAGSMPLLARAARTLPTSSAYAVWVGLGVVGGARRRRASSARRCRPRGSRSSC